MSLLSVHVIKFMSQVHLTLAIGKIVNLTNYRSSFFAKLFCDQESCARELKRAKQKANQAREEELGLGIKGRR